MFKVFNNGLLVMILFNTVLQFLIYEELDGHPFMVL